MNNNDIFRRLRYTLDLKDKEVIDMFGIVQEEVTRSKVSAWLKKEDDDVFESMHDVKLSAFLNGLIASKRGLRDGIIPKAEKKLNNNLILRKLKIAFSLKDSDFIEIFNLAKFRVSKHELSAFFRAPSQKQYRECKDQFLRNFLTGLQIKHRGEFVKRSKEDMPWLEK